MKEITPKEGHVLRFQYMPVYTHFSGPVVTQSIKVGLTCLISQQLGNKSEEDEPWSNSLYQVTSTKTKLPPIGL